MRKVDLAKTSLRELNQDLHRQTAGSNEGNWEIINSMGFHAVAAGVDATININIRGSVGYYCGGMNKQASITVHGSAGPGVAENMMSGNVRITGDASQYAGATGHGGMLLIEGNAASRCGVSMKGIDIVVKGNIGHLSAFMAQSGHLGSGRRGRCARRFHLRSQVVRARKGEKPRRRLHREGNAPRAS